MEPLVWQEHLTQILSPSEIILPTDPSYTTESQTWAAQKNQSPKLIAQPSNAEKLGKLLSYLSANSGIDYAVRCTGVGSASAHDLLISLAAFDAFEFNESDLSVTVGAGQSWGNVDAKMEEVAPGYSVVGARCTYVGIGGSVLAGGISWLSSEFGLATDPQNMLDAQIVKTNGEVVWASMKPDLMWALRGGGGGFGVMVQVKMRVHQYPKSIYSGQITFPRSAFITVSKAISRFAAECQDPKMAMHIFPLDLSEGHFTGEAQRPGIGLQVFDAHGEVHGRSDRGFKWALDIDGAKDQTSSMTIRQCNQIWDGLEAAKGKTTNFHSCITIPQVDEQLILNAWQWIEELQAKDPALALGGTYVLIEFMQKPAFHSAEPSSRAWPGTGGVSVLQLGTGAPSDRVDTVKLAYEALKEAPYQIRHHQEHSQADYFTHSHEQFNDPSKIYGKNFEKLKQLKRKYDPSGGLKGPFLA